MAKAKIIYVCQQCGYSTSGWLGKCPSCGSWGSLAEEESDSSGQKQPAGGKRSAHAAHTARAYRLDEIDAALSGARDTTGIHEFDRVLGGGLVKGSLVLVGGDPGIGKSTLLLQMCSSYSHRILYISGEESVGQLQMRARRLGVGGGGRPTAAEAGRPDATDTGRPVDAETRRPGAAETELLIAAETGLQTVERLISNYAPETVIIDSIQTMYDDGSAGAPGSLGQIRGVTNAFMRIAKTTKTSFIIVGHVTKDGAIAGPKALEHMVDTVLYFEGERSGGLRLLRAVKNRFGPTDEVGVFDMTEYGLIEVKNPSAAILGERPRGVPGSVVVPSAEGTRSMLVEIQALASFTNAQIPRRMAAGVDYNRMTLMIAILEKRMGLKLYDCDVYVNVTGGIKIYEPACDLGIVAAVASSFRDKAFDPDAAIVGEVGLTGEVRGVSHLERRLNEAARLGFLRCVVPEGSLSSTGRVFRGEAKNLELIPAKHIIKIFDLFC